jgi:DNA-binding CsgD family transcriptional regulator/sugar-specific transcriptional regulator TrmB
MQRYRQVVEEGELTAESVPRCLWALGLVAQLPSRTDTVVPVPTQVAAATAVAPHEREVAERRQAIEGIVRAFSDVETIYAEAIRKRQPNITLLQGAETIGRTISAAVDNCSDEIITAQPGGGRPAEILEKAVEQSLGALRRGVRQRTLYQHSVRTHVPTLDYIEAITQAGAEVRTLDEMFDRLIICDLTVAFVPTNRVYEDEALEIREPGIVRFLSNVFQYAWSRGIEVVPSRARTSPEVARDLERALVRMLVAGNTEDKIARDLGLSRRTVAQHTSRLSQRLGSRSRAQLGYLIAVKGLLDEPSLGRPALRGSTRQVAGEQQSPSICQKRISHGSSVQERQVMAPGGRGGARRGRPRPRGGQQPGPGGCRHVGVLPATGCPGHHQPHGHAVHHQLQ